MTLLLPESSIQKSSPKDEVAVPSKKEESIKDNNNGKFLSIQNEMLIE